MLIFITILWTSTPAIVKWIFWYLILNNGYFPSWKHTSIIFNQTFISLSHIETKKIVVLHIILLFRLDFIHLLSVVFNKYFKIIYRLFHYLCSKHHCDVKIYIYMFSMCSCMSNQVIRILFLCIWFKWFVVIKMQCHKINLDHSYSIRSSSLHWTGLINLTGSIINN